jgi:antitoxin VapB
MSMFPAATFDAITLAEANRCLIEWGHRMGPLERGNSAALHCHALIVHGVVVGLACTSSLIRECVGGGLGHMTRGNTVELSRLCALEPWACRVVLRLWREVVFPQLGYRWAISYQDADIHTGNTYRFDGWRREGFSSSGTDQRSGRRGRRKWIWVWQLADFAVMENAA